MSYPEPSKMILMQWNVGHIKARGKSPTNFKGPGSHPECLVKMSEHSSSQIQKKITSTRKQLVASETTTIKQPYFENRSFTFAKFESKIQASSYFSYKLVAFSYNLLSPYMPPYSIWSFMLPRMKVWCACGHLLQIFHYEKKNRNQK